MIIEEINVIDEGKKMPQKKYTIKVGYTTNV